MRGQSVLTASAPVPSLGWMLFIELPVREAYAPLYASVLRSGALLLGGTGVGGIGRNLPGAAHDRPHSSAARRRGKDRPRRSHPDEYRSIPVTSSRRSVISSTAWRSSFRTCTRRSSARWSNAPCSSSSPIRRSPDLWRRQVTTCGSRCMHWGCLLHSCARATGVKERSHIVDRVDAAIATMNDLFNALLDISKLDAGVLSPKLSDFPVQHVLHRARNNVRRSGTREGAVVSGCSQRCLGAQRFHSARADTAESGFQRNPLHISTAASS